MRTYLSNDTLKYYKYSYSTYNHPTLTACGTMGGNSYAIMGKYSGTSSNSGTSNVWKVLSPNNTFWGFYCDEYGGWMRICFYTPIETKITNISFTVRASSSSDGDATSTKLYGGYCSFDEHTLLLNIGTVTEGKSCDKPVTVDKYFKYFTLYTHNQGSAYNDGLYLKNLLFAGTQRTAVESTRDNYDYVTGSLYKAYFDETNNTYKALL